jgi:hypothetical protein
MAIVVAASHVLHEGVPSGTVRSELIVFRPRPPQSEFERL